MNNIQKTLNGESVFPESAKLLREIHNIKINETINEKNLNLNKYFHSKDEKLIIE